MRRIGLRSAVTANAAAVHAARYSSTANESSSSSRADSKSEKAETDPTESTSGGEAGNSRSYASRVFGSSAFQIAAGFGVGFGAWLAMEKGGAVDELTVLDARHAARKAAFELRHGGAAPGDDTTTADDSVLASIRRTLDAQGLFQIDPPHALSPSEALKMQREKQAAQSDDRATFSEVLLGCPLEEQLEWLADHVSESVPYFYIEELVHTWASIHYARHMYGQDVAPARADDDDGDAAAAKARRERIAIAAKKVESATLKELFSYVGDVAKDALTDATSVLGAVFQDIEAIDKRAQQPSATPDGVDVLVCGLWHLLQQGTIPPNCGWAALSVLVNASDEYALALAKHVAVDTGVSPVPYQPERWVELPRPPAGEGEADDDTPMPKVPVFSRHNRPKIRSEAEALASFAAVLQAARSITMRHGEPRGDAPDELRACGPPLDLITRGRGQFEKRPLTPPLADFRAAFGAVDRKLRGTDAGDNKGKVAVSRGDDVAAQVVSGSIAAAMDPLVSTLAAVDAALAREAARQQRNRYDFAWTHPVNWTFPLLKAAGVKSAPPELDDAARRGVRLPLAALGSGAGGAAESESMTPTSTTALSVRQQPELPFRLRKDRSLATALQLVGSRDSAGGTDPEGLVKWLREYTAAAARHIEQVSENAASSSAASESSASERNRAVTARCSAAVRLAFIASAVEGWFDSVPPPHGRRSSGGAEDDEARDDDDDDDDDDKADLAAADRRAAARQRLRLLDAKLQASGQGKAARGTL